MVSLFFLWPTGLHKCLKCLFVRSILWSGLHHSLGLSLMLSWTTWEIIRTYICWLCFHLGQWHNGGKCELRRTATKDETSWRIMSGQYWQNKCSRTSPPWPPWGRNDNKKIPCYIFFLGTKEKWKFNQDRERPVERSSHS